MDETVFFPALSPRKLCLSTVLVFLHNFALFLFLGLGL